MRRTLLAIALFAIPLSACGAASTTSSTKYKGEQANVAKVVDNLVTDGRSHNAAKICNDILAKQLVAELKAAGGDCETEMKRAIDDASDYDLQIKSITVNGQNATAQVRQGAAGPVTTFAFVKENGGWRASDLG